MSGLEGRERTRGDGGVTLKTAIVTVTYGYFLLAVKSLECLAAITDG